MFVTYQVKIGGWHGLTDLRLETVQKDDQKFEVNEGEFGRNTRFKQQKLSAKCPGYFKADTKTL